MLYSNHLSRGDNIRWSNYYHYTHVYLSHDLLKTIITSRDGSQAYPQTNKGLARCGRKDLGLRLAPTKLVHDGLSTGDFAGKQDLVGGHYLAHYRVFSVLGLYLVPHW